MEPKTRSQWNVLYDAQIQALQNSDYKKFAELIDYDGDITAINTHYKCWNNTEEYPKSIFSALPGFESECVIGLGLSTVLCASTIEYSTNPMLLALQNCILANKLTTLPDMNVYAGKPRKKKFTRLQLTEFKRRQMLVRGFA